MSATIRYPRLLLGTIVLVGLLARLPGVFWGANFPFGWWGHHVDEYTHLVNAEQLISPQLPPRWPPNPYPMGLAAHVAVPFLGLRALEGRLMDPLPSSQSIVTLGRLVSVAYGTATIVLVFLLSRLVVRDARVAYAAAFILALTGLHVTQSHFFVADAPFLFWWSASSYLIMRGLLGCGPSDDWLLVATGACVGAAVGIKIAGATVTSLVLYALWRRPRIYRLVLAAGFAIVGFVLINMNAYPLKEIVKTLSGTGSEHIKSFSRLQGLLLYLIQLPALFSAPVLALVVAGVVRGRHAWRALDSRRKMATGVALILPALLWGAVVLLMANNFPRHILPFTPLVALAAAYGLIGTMDALRRHGVPAVLPVALLVAYLAVFVFDGERVFIQDPRNLAAQWLREHVPAGAEIWWQGHGGAGGYTPIVFPGQGRPPVLVMELHRANSYLSGMGWKNSMPANLSEVHGIQSQAVLQSLQDVFRGTTEYREVARFSEGYFMPEFRVVDGLIGNRARNYVSEILIFQRPPD